MPLAITSKGMTPSEFERFRLALSVFQDGTGWESRKLRRSERRITYAGYRQFERIIAELFKGVAGEDKGIFDVIIELDNESRYYGISCKMKNGLKDALKPDGFTYIEVSNAAGKFLDTVKDIVGPDYLTRPQEAGLAILNVVQRWYDEAAKRYKLDIDLGESSHLVLLYDDELNFKLYQHRLQLPSFEHISWEYRLPKKANESRCLVGRANERKLVEWYLSSGGQLKYYPPVSEAVWTSDVFQMEPLPESVEIGVMARAEQYFGGRAADMTE